MTKKSSIFELTLTDLRERPFVYPSIRFASQPKIEEVKLAIEELYYGGGILSGFQDRYKSYDRDDLMFNESFKIGDGWNYGDPKLGYLLTFREIIIYE